MKFCQVEVTGYCIHFRSNVCNISFNSKHFRIIQPIPSKKVEERLAGQVEDFHVLHFAGFYAETEGGADNVPALDAAGAGIDGEHVVVPVVLDL